jgi:hypothetical protein
MFDILIGDEEHIPKLAKILLGRLIYLGRAFRFQILAGKVLSIDKDAQNLCLRLAFAVQTRPRKVPSKSCLNYRATLRRLGPMGEKQRTRSV